MFIFLLGFTSITQANDNYIVHAKIYNNKKVIGAPILVVNSNQEALISVDKLYRLGLKVIPIDNVNIALTTDLRLAGESISPTLIIALGEEARIRVGGKELSVIVNKSAS